jgi:hypothetical protein
MASASPVLLGPGRSNLAICDKHRDLSGLVVVNPARFLCEYTIAASNDLRYLPRFSHSWSQASWPCPSAALDRRAPRLEREHARDHRVGGLVLRAARRWISPSRSRAVISVSAQH